MDPRRTHDGHEVIAADLHARGISHVFTVGGTPVHETLSACARHGIRVIGVHHQHAGAMMSAAFNYVSGHLASAVVLSAGPAITHAVTGVLVAHDNDLPLLVLGGCRPLDMRGKGTFQDLDAVAIFRPVTRHAGLVASPDEIAPALERACDIAVGARFGPVYLEIPEEALNGRATRDAPQPGRRAARKVDRDAIERAATLLRNASRPALLVGSALRWTSPFHTLARLVDRLDAPFAAPLYAQGYLPDDHRLCFNAVRARMLATADVVLVAGTRLDWTVRYGAEIASAATVIALGVDERGAGGNVAPAMAIEGDPAAALEALVQALGPGPTPAAAGDRWRADLATARDERARADETLERDDRSPMTEARLVAEVRRFASRDTFFVVDGNRILETAQRHMPTFEPVSRLTPGHNGCMGVGVPFGIGAKLARPDRGVLVVTGDLAFALCVMEMETAVRLRVPLVVVVANNDGNGGGRSERKYYPPEHPDRVTMFQPGLRYDEIARTLGAHGERVERVDELAPALARAAASGVAALVDVRVRIHDG